MLNLKRKTKIILACSVLLSLLLLSSWALIDITIYNLDFKSLNSSKLSPRDEICRPCMDIQCEWDYPVHDPPEVTHYSRINENIQYLDSPNGIRIGDSGFVETETDTFELTTLTGGEEAEFLESITIYTYCTCWAGRRGVSKLKVSYQLCLNDEWSDWSSEKLVYSTFSWRWKTFTWYNLGIELSEPTTIILRVKLVSDINSRIYGGDVYVDALYAEVSFEDKFEDRLDWGINAIDAEVVWGGLDGATDISPGLVAGEGINVCILDTGMDTDHLDLIGNFEGGYDFYEMDAIPEDADGHGTHVAGIVGAIDNEFGVIGVAPKVNLYICRVGHSKPINTSVLNAIQWAIDNNMDIISMSWGGYFPDVDEEQALNEAFDAGIVLIAASGNYYNLECESQFGDIIEEDMIQTAVNYPAAYDFVTAVGALKKSQTDYIRWTERDCKREIEHGHNIWYENGSCYNEGLENGNGLDISAPGVNINSTCCLFLDGSIYDKDGIVNGYAILTGTSMACPMVAGVCALILNASPTIYNLSGSDRVRAVWHCLYNSTVPVGGVQYNMYGWHEEYGYGMVNASAAVNYAIDY